MNKLKKVIALMLIVLTMSSCFKRDDLEGVDIYTTVYPVEYITDYLYGYNSNIKSIYPAETNPTDYTLTKKQISEYSAGSIFVYNGLTNEKSIARDLLNANTNLKIIDVSQGLEYEYGIEELWLNPSDYLMVAHNIKNGLEDYISNKYIIEEIEVNYEKLKVLISSYDAELEMLPDNSVDTNIIVATNTLNFLSKYGLTITNIDNSAGEVSASTMNKAKKLVENKTVKFIYMLDTDEETDYVKILVNAGATVKKIRTMSTLTETETNSNANYKTLMRDNIDAIKEEVYEQK